MNKICLLNKVTDQVTFSLKSNYALSLILKPIYKQIKESISNSQ